MKPKESALFIRQHIFWVDRVIAQMNEKKNLLSCIVKRMAIIWKIIKVLFYENTFDVLKCNKTWLLLDSKRNISRMLHPNMKAIETHTGISKLNVYKKWNRERRKNGNKCERILISSIRLKGVSLL